MSRFFGIKIDSYIEIVPLFGFVSLDDLKECGFSGVCSESHLKEIYSSLESFNLLDE